MTALSTVRQSAGAALSAVRRSASAYAALLRHGPFTTLFAGRMVSTLGDNLYLVASTWLVYDLTGSTFFAGVAGFLGYLPKVFRFAVGPVVDRLPASRVLTWSELSQLLIVLVVPVTAALGELGPVAVLGIVPFLSASSQVSKPAQYALLPQVLSDERLPRANSLFSMSRRGVQALGKSLGGGLVAVVGAVTVYLVDAGTFLVGAALFAVMPVDDTVAVGEASRDRSTVDEYLDSVRTGVETVRGSSTLLLLVGGTALANFTTGMTTAVLPAFGDLFGGAEVYGVLYAAVGAGLFAGSLIGGELFDFRLRRVLVVGFGLSGVGWIATGLSPTLVVALGCLIAAWVSMGAYNVAVATAIQIGVPDGQIGRVTALDGSLSGVASATALLIGGRAGDVLGARAVVVATGLSLLALTAVAWTVTSPDDLPAVDDIGDGSFVNVSTSQEEQ